MPTQRKKPKTMTVEQQEMYDAIVEFLKALAFTVFMALGLTIGWNLATPISHLGTISPFAVWGIIIFFDFAAYTAKRYVRTVR